MTNAIASGAERPPSLSQKLSALSLGLAPLGKGFVLGSVASVSVEDFGTLP